MKCQRCRRKLTALISIQRGYGPVCWKKEGQYSNIKLISVVNPESKKLPRNLNTPVLDVKILKNLIGSIASKISSKNLELLSILKIAKNPNHILSTITEQNEVIDKIIKPIFRIEQPFHNSEGLVFTI